MHIHICTQEWKVWSVYDDVTHTYDDVTHTYDDVTHTYDDVTHTGMEGVVCIYSRQNVFG